MCAPDIEPACAEAVGPANAAVVVQAAAIAGAPVNQQMAAVMQSFSGDDSYTGQAFIHDFDEAAAQSAWTEPQQFMFAKRLLVGTAKTLLTAVNVHTWPDLRKELRAEFVSAMSISAVHKALANRRKQTSETAQQYCIAMRQIALMAEHRLDERDLIAYIVDGLAQDKSDRLFFAAATTFNELRALIVRHKETIGIVSGSSAPSSAMQRRNPFSSSSSFVGPTTASPSARQRCYNCQEEGHFALDAWRNGYAAALAESRTVATNMGAQQEHRMAANTDMADGHRQQAMQSSVHNVGAAEQLVDTAVHNNNFVEQVSMHILNGASRAVITFGAFLDTGSPACFVQSRYIPPAFFCDSGSNQKFVGLNCSPLCVLGTICASVNFRGQRFDNVRFHIVPRYSAEVSCSRTLYVYWRIRLASCAQLWTRFAT